MSAARPALPSRAEYLREWSSLHGGAASGGLVGWWLGIAYRVARPAAAAGVRPDALTLAGLALAVMAVLPAGAGGRWPLVAATLVAASGVVDNLDGAVAVLTGKATRRGFVLDSVCDRVADGAYVAALWAAGAPGPLAVAGGALAWLHEYLRARAAAGGMSEIGVVTVAERPTRVIVTAMFLIGAALYPAAAGVWVTLGATAWVTLGVVGFVQLGVTVVRRLR